MADIISKVIPILLLIFLGYFMQLKKVVTSSSVDEIKKIVVNIALPAVLFITFLNMDFKREYFWVITSTFVLLLIFYLAGVALNKIKKIYHPINPFIVTGCAFGLLGIPLYGTVFGMENLGKISIFGAGHEFFVWIVFFTVLRMKFNDEKFSSKVLMELFKSPMIISIALGIIFNITGLKVLFSQISILKGIYDTIQYLSSLSTPLMLIVIGFDLKFNKIYLKESVRFLIIRFTVIFTIGYLFKYIIIDRFIPRDPLVDYAYFTFLILPPPFSLPVIMGKYNIDQYKDIVNNTVVLATIICISLYLLFVLFI